MKITSKALAIVIFVTLFGGITITTVLNWWQTESSKIPAVYKEGEAAGQYDPADIRGSYTFADIETAFKVPAAELAAAFAIETQEPGSITVKELETVYSPAAEQGYEIGTTSVRLFVALYSGLPYELSEDTYLPRQAVEILIAHGSLSTDQIAYLEDHTLPDAAQNSSSQLVAASEAVAATSESDSARLIKGKTTFQEVLDWGLSPDVIINNLGVGLPNPLTKIKDFCTEKNLDFETVKTALQAEVDKINP